MRPFRPRIEVWAKWVLDVGLAATGLVPLAVVLAMVWVVMPVGVLAGLLELLGVLPQSVLDIARVLAPAGLALAALVGLWWAARLVEWPAKREDEPIDATLRRTADLSTVRELGLPPIGSDVVRRTRLFGDQNFKVTDFIPADEYGPNSLVLTDADGIETTIELPLQQDESIILSEEAARQTATDEFVQRVSEVVRDGHQRVVFREMLTEAGTTTLKDIPEDQRQRFLANLKSRIGQAAVAQQVGRDADRLLRKDVSDIRELYMEWRSFDEAEIAVRKKMGLRADAPVPAVRRRTYLELHKRHAARAKKAAAASERGRPPGRP